MVRFGVHAGPQECGYDDLHALWKHLEAVGYDWISIWDHFYPAQVAPDGDCLEAVACHAALAASTSRVRVGSLVYSAGYRHPAVLANAAVTIDHISGGRLEFGIGAGWHQDEYDAYGLPYESAPQRLRRLAEAVEVIRLLWTEDVSDYRGEFFTLARAYCNPKPVQRPPRIWIGASGERLALPLVGRLADGWNCAYVGPDAFARKYDVVREHAPDPARLTAGVNVGLVWGETDPEAALERRYGAAANMVKAGTLYGSVPQMVEKVGRYVEAGADWIILAVRAPFDLVALERFHAEVVPQVS